MGSEWDARRRGKADLDSECGDSRAAYSRGPPHPEALAELSSIFSRMYAKVGRPSFPPEHLLKECLLMALYSTRSERQFCERLQYDLLFKWFLDLNIMDPAFYPSTHLIRFFGLVDH